jgi:hypothetical protein
LRHSFSQSSVLGVLTLLVRNAIARHVSGLALLVTYRAFATMVWKPAAAPSDIFSQPLFTVNKLSGTAVLKHHFAAGTNPLPYFYIAASNACRIPSR